MHYSFAKEAMEHGKHVILEKPITANTSELRELIALAQKYQVMMVEAMNIHYMPAYETESRAASHWTAPDRQHEL